MATGISTFTGASTPVIMQHKADKTFAHTSVTHDQTPAFITIPNHGYFSGDKVQYIAGTSPIGGLTDRRTYFIIRQDHEKVQLAQTMAHAKPPSGQSTVPIDLTGTGTGTHRFELRSKSNDATAASSADGVGLSVDQLHVVGIATFPAAVTLTNVNISRINVSGVSTFNDVVDINASADFSQPVTINSTLNANGHINLGDADSDTITAVGRFDSNLIPTPDGSNTNGRDLGSDDNEWRDLYLSLIHI